MNFFEKQIQDLEVINNALLKAGEEDKEEEDIEDFIDDDEEEDAEIRNEAWRMCEHSD